jgi:tetratricopeptide (TPR) repeat protein
LLIQVKSYDEARTVFEELIQEQPQNLDLLYTVGLLNLQAEQYAAAESNFKRLVSSGKRTDVGHYYLGRVAEKRERYKQALNWYRKVDKGEYYLDAQTRVADLYVKLGNLEDARAHFKKLRDEASKSETAIKLYLAEGQLLREQAEYHAGMEMFNRALTEHPGNGDLLYARALMAEKIDRIDLLEADLRAILEDDPDNATALNALGYTLADRNERIPEAYEYIQRALKVRPDDPTVIDSMGWVQYRMGNYDKAEEYLRKAYRLLQDAEVTGHLSEIVWAQGNKDEARSLLQQALDIEPENDYLLKLKQRFSD